MRPRPFLSGCLRALPLVAALAACVPSGPYTVVQNPTPAPPPPAPARRVVPVEITVVRPDQGRLLVQTNRSSYVALFEIVPGRGVALLYPGSTRQRTVLLSGLNWVSVWWMLRTPSEERRYSAVSGTTERYVYAVAADRPLRITDDAYDPNYLRRLLGPNAYASSNPNTVVRALQRQFIPTMLNEEWGEDLYAVAPSYGREPYRIARVYCPDGSVFEVREDMANRAWCPPTTRRRVPGYPPPREEPTPVATVPDSVLSPTGTRVTRRPLDPRQTTPPYRVPADMPQHEPVQPAQPAPPPSSPPTLAPPTPPASPKTQPSPADPKGEKEKDHADNGRRAQGDPANADPRGRGNGRGNGGGIQPPPTTEVITQQGKPRTAQPDSARDKEKPDKNDKNDKNDKAQPAAEPKDKQAEAKKKMDEMLRKAGVKPKADSSTPPKP